MAKTSKKKSQNEPISVSEIYETIQARDFLRELWWDLISDIQEKPTYKRLKGMVTDVINNTIQDFTSKPVDANEELKRRTALTEISIMTYTLDTVITEVLSRRLENEYEDIIKDLIEDLLKNRTKEASLPVESESVFENIEEIFNDRKKDNAVVMAKKSYIPFPKRGRPKKIHVSEEKTNNVDTPAKRKRGRPPITSKTTTTTKKLDDKKVNLKVYKESDAESEISVGNFSIDSVSSVHTSELSSFEDTVSLCSNDEGEKKHIPLKVANDMYLQGNLSQIYQFGKKSEKLKLIKNASISKNLAKASPSSSRLGSSSRKVLPQRIRKPNSKYSSDTMYSEVKDYSSPPPDSGSSSSQDELEMPSTSPKIKRRRKISSLKKKETVNNSSSSQNVSSNQNSSPPKKIKAKNSPLSKTSTKRYDTSDLYKPHAATGNITGSRSSAVTLFST